MSSTKKPDTSGDLRSPALPGGSLIRALLDRRLMGLADMGGSSALIGSSWSDIVAKRADALVGAELAIPGGGYHQIERIIRLDTLPHVGHAASKKSLQNPDFVLLGRANGNLTLQAADAKFSIETARSKQVSAEMLSALAAVGEQYTGLLGDWRDDGEIVPGLFFAPRSALSRFVLSGGRGIMRATVRPDEVELLESSGAELTRSIPGDAVRDRLATLDGLEDRLRDELLCGVYYTRLSSAAGASWFDMHRPLLGPSIGSGPDFEAICIEVRDRGRNERTAYDLVTHWAEDAEVVRADRATIGQAVALPLANRELREWVLADAEAAGLDAPSLNQVRKKLQRWVQSQVLDEIGVIEPNDGQTSQHAAHIRKLVAKIATGARGETARIVLELGTPSESTDGR